jgi:hypothetical protein
LNTIPACSIGWSRPHIGPLFRGERRIRFYGNSFSQPLSTLAACGLLRLTGKIIRNPPLRCFIQHLRSDHLFIWDQTPHWSDYFGSLRDFCDLVTQLVWRMVNASVRQRVMERVPPTVAVHIRCGDFRRLRSGEDFRKVGGTRTPLDYFVTLIREIRRCQGSIVPVTVFTDGHPSEIEAVLALPAVQMAARDKPIVDLLLMSRAQLIITSASSTFGYWAGFLADCPVLLHPDHIHASLRPQSINDRFFEGPAVGPFEGWPDLLIRNVKQVRDLSG